MESLLPETSMLEKIMTFNNGYERISSAAAVTVLACPPFCCHRYASANT